MGELTRVLSGWVGLPRTEIVYDSDVHGAETARFRERVGGRQDIAVVAVTTEGDVFGGYVSAQVRGTGGWHADDQHFIFSFNARGRCAVPQHWLLDKTKHGEHDIFWVGRRETQYVSFCSLIHLNRKPRPSLCIHVGSFYVGASDRVLSGTNFPDVFTTERIIAVHFF